MGLGESMCQDRLRKILKLSPTMMNILEEDLSQENYWSKYKCIRVLVVELMD